MTTKADVRRVFADRQRQAYREALAGRDRQSPPDRDAARVAARELRANGLTVADVASAIGISEGAVAELLGETP
ncbi:MAG TPA: hypothetical protein VJ738_05375 [Steroidobacteraceae bacterium]|nr:hypothetical protein [Steroidobacteraceae bacterium]